MTGDAGNDRRCGRGKRKASEGGEENAMKHKKMTDGHVRGRMLSIDGPDCKRGSCRKLASGKKVIAKHVLYTNKIHVLLSNFNNKLLNKHKVIMPRVAKDTVFTV